MFKHLAYGMEWQWGKHVIYTSLLASKDSGEEYIYLMYGMERLGEACYIYLTYGMQVSSREGESYNDFQASNHQSKAS